LAETGIGYRLLDSLYAPSTLHDPSAHRSIPILAARRLDPSNLVELDAFVGSIHSITPPTALMMPDWLPREVSSVIPAFVRPRHCGPDGRSLAKTCWCRVRALIGDPTPFSRPICFPHQRPPSTGGPRPSDIVDVSMGSAGGPVASSLRPRPRRSPIGPPSS